MYGACICEGGLAVGFGNCVTIGFPRGQFMAVYIIRVDGWRYAVGCYLQATIHDHFADTAVRPNHSA